MEFSPGIQSLFQGTRLIISKYPNLFSHESVTVFTCFKSCNSPCISFFFYGKKTKENNNTLNWLMNHIVCLYQVSLSGLCVVYCCVSLFVHLFSRRSKLLMWSVVRSNILVKTSQMRITRLKYIAI